MVERPQTNKTSQLRVMASSKINKARLIEGDSKVIDDCIKFPDKNVIWENCLFKCSLCRSAITLITNLMEQEMDGRLKTLSLCKHQ